MPTASLRRFLTGWICFVGLAGTVVPLRAQPAATEPFKEQTIYIPYTKLREIFETEKRGVFLPYEKFQELWRAARENKPVDKEAKPPVDALIGEVDNEAIVSRDVVKVSAKVQIELLGSGWHEVPLRLNDAAVTSAQIDGKPARLIYRKESGYHLLVERPKDGPKQIELFLEYARTFTKQPGANSVSFQAPQAPVSRWRVRIDEPGVKIDIHPLIAASDVPAADPKAARSEILAFVGAAAEVRINWTPRAEGAADLEVLAGVQTEQQVFLDENVTRTRAVILYTISRAELKELRIDVPAAHRVVNVFDANVRRWTVEKATDAKAATQRIVVELFEPAKQKQSVVVELEQIVPEADVQTTAVPVVAAVGVGRQQGIVVVQAAEGLRAEAVKRSGLLQLDVGDLPPSLAKGRWSFSYRYSTVPFDLTLSVEKVRPWVTADLLVEAALQPDSLVLDVKARYTIERAGVFRLELEVPTGYDVREARGFGCDGVEPAAVDTFRVEGEQKNRLIVNLSRKAMGGIGLQVQLSKTLNDAELKTPLGRAATISLPLPRVATGTAERSSGRLLVYAPESLRVNPGAAEGLRAVSFQEALAGFESVRSTNLSGLRPVQAFTFADSPAKLALEAERRKPQVTVAQLLTAAVEPGVVKYNATFRYEILFSGVRSLRIDLPEGVAAKAHNDTPGVRESVVAPPPDDLAPGDVAWSLTGDSEFLGNVVLRLSWETPLDKLDVGSSVDVALPHLKPRQIDRAWGQIALVKSEAIDLHEAGEPTGVRPIDPQHDLMPGASVAGAARAFEFHDAWKLTVTATRYKLEEVKHTSIERAVVRAVVTRSGQTSVQGLYQMRSARQRLALQLPDGATFDTEPLRINGKSVALESGGQGRYFVPLVGQDPDKPFLLEIRYTLQGQGTTFDLPTFVDDPAIQKVYLCAYLPEEWAVRSADGPWSDEIRWQWSDTDWRYSGGAGYVPLPIRSDAELVAWVSQGIGLPTNPFDAFEKDGRLFVFSTLRPEPAPAGSLRLKTVGRTTLNWLMLLAIVGVGLAFVRQPPAARATALGLVVVGLVLLTVFQPILIHELVNSVFLWSWVVVGVVWSVAWFVRRRPRPVIIAASSVEPPIAGPPNEPAPSEPSSAEPPTTGGADHG
jgi:hypothetical protein